MKSPKYRPGSTSRITVTSVREDACAFHTDTPENLLRFWREIIEKQPEHEPDKESVVVVMMNSRLRPYAWHRVSLGSVNECAAHPREILRPVIVSGAYGFAVMHNHPSGDPGPSRADEAITRRISEAANLMQLKFLDHEGQQPRLHPSPQQPPSEHPQAHRHQRHHGHPDAPQVSSPTKTTQPNQQP